MIAKLFQELSHLINWQEVDQRPVPRRRIGSQNSFVPHLSEGKWNKAFLDNHPPKQLRILMVTPYYYPQRGPIENHVYQVVQRLAQAGHDVTVLTSSANRHFEAQEQVDGINIQRVAASLEQDTYDAALDLYTTIRYGQWDIVHLQSSHTLVGLLGMYAAAQARIPYVVTLHGGDYVSDPHHTLYHLQHRLLRPLLLRASRLIAPTQFALDYYTQRLQLPAERFTLIPNGNDFESHWESHPSEQEILITAVGRIESSFGQHRMIAALPHILAHYPYARLRILGKDLNQAVLERQAQVLGVAEHVEITTIPEFNEAVMEALTVDMAMVTAWGNDHPYMAALFAAMAPNSSILISNCAAPLCDSTQADQLCIVDTASTPQELATAVVEQLYSVFTRARRHLPTWDDCVSELLPLYHAFSDAIWEPQAQQSAQFN